MNIDAGCLVKREKERGIEGTGSCVLVKGKMAGEGCCCDAVKMQLFLRGL